MSTSRKRKILRAQARAGESPIDVAERVIFDEGRRFPNLEAAQLAKESALAVLRQVEADLAIGKVVLIEDVVRELAAEYHVLRNAILSLGARLARQLVNRSDPNIVQAIIDDEATDLLTELSSRTSPCLKSKSTSENGRG